MVTDDDIYFNQALAAARQGDWDTAIKNALRSPPSWDVWQRFPHEHQIYEEGAHKILDALTSFGAGFHEKNLDSFVYEYSGQLPGNATPKLLNRLAKIIDPENNHLTISQIKEHPNWKPDKDMARLEGMANFWAEYERKVLPHHFATVKAWQTGQPVVNFKDHRGQTGDSLSHGHVIEAMADYAKKTQETVRKDVSTWARAEEKYKKYAEQVGDFLKIKYINGEPHIRVFRGISGDYGAAIAKKANLDLDTGRVDKKTLTIPTTCFGSWTSDPELAQRFAMSRNDIVGQENMPLVMKKWLPLKNLLHSGFHTVVPGQDHAHPEERELIFSHPEEHIRMATKDLQRQVTREDGFKSFDFVTVRESPGEPIKKSLDLSSKVHASAAAMLGIDQDLFNIFEAARFLSGRGEVSPELMRQALWEANGSPKKAALRAYGLAPTEENLEALRGILKVGSLSKVEVSADETPQGKVVVSLVPEGEEFAGAISRAFRDEFVVAAKLGGKHSQGSFLARDPEDHRVYLMKPGRGDSPALGTSQQPASPSRREAAFYAVAKDWGLDEYVPECQVVVVDGKEYATMPLLPSSYVTMEKKRVEEGSYATKIFSGYLARGLLHRWGTLFYICGEPDGHAQNEMTDQDEDIRLIDHGSSFAGDSFCPAFDKNSFIPYFLRVWAPEEGFNQMGVEEKLRALPRVSVHMAEELKVWFKGLSVGRLEALLRELGVEPQAILARFEQVKVRLESAPLDLVINRLWTSGD